MRFILPIFLLFSSAVASAQKYYPSLVPSGYLSKDDQKILRRGEITDGEYVGGGVLGSIIGLGTGHLVQRRYPFKGMIFTIGEGAGALTFLVFGGWQACAATGSPGDPNPNYCSELQIGQTVGIAIFAGFKVWEIIDLWITPPALNRRYHELRQKFNRSQEHHLHFEPLYVLHDHQPNDLYVLPGFTLGLEF
jgi:hypothetical protein